MKMGYNYASSFTWTQCKLIGIRNCYLRQEGCFHRRCLFVCLLTGYAKKTIGPRFSHNCGKVARVQGRNH